MVAPPFLTLPAIVLAGFLWTFPSQAHAFCGDREAVLNNLEETYSEVPEDRGLASNGSVIELVVSPSGSFTILYTMPSGLACVMAAGENWGPVEKKTPGEPA